MKLATIIAIALLAIALQGCGQASDDPDQGIGGTWTVQGNPVFHFSFDPATGRVNRGESLCAGHPCGAYWKQGTYEINSWEAQPDQPGLWRAVMTSFWDNALYLDALYFFDGAVNAAINQSTEDGLTIETSGIPGVIDPGLHQFTRAAQ